MYSKDTLDPINFAQDPTYLSFHIEFFFAEDVASPNVKFTPQDYYATDDFLLYDFSHNGLFLPPKYDVTSGSPPTNTSPNDKSIKKTANPRAEYTFTDSAEDYLYSIGAVNKLASLRSFKKMLYSLQTQTPWYFQKITGAESLYTVDKAVNSKKDGELTFECLESIDQRVSMLADLYRLAAWDFERHREVLPYNLRTFKMRIHVFEMRNFNTYSGTIANFLKNSSDEAYQNQLKAYWQLSAAQQAELLDPVTGQELSGSSVSRGAGGNANSGIPAISTDLSSAFNAITVRTYELNHCEFDFFSTAPSYLSDLSVNEVPMSSFAFKIKYGTVRNITNYSFYRFLLDSVVSASKFPLGTGPFINSVSPGNVVTKNTFYEPGGRNTLAAYDNPSIPPGQEDIEAAYTSAMKSKFDAEQTLINQSPQRLNLGRGLIGTTIGALESRLNTAVQGVVSKVNSALLGNVYDNIPSPAEVSGVLRGFIAGDKTINTPPLSKDVSPNNVYS